MKLINKIILLIILVTSSINAQDYISLDLGLTGNYHTYFRSINSYTFATELKLGGGYSDSIFEWNLFISYWDDLIRDDSIVQDGKLYTYSNYTIGYRINLFPKEMLIPSYLGLGISLHHVPMVNLVKRWTLDYDPNDDTSREFFTIDAAIGFYWPLAKSFRIRGEIVANIPFVKIDLIPDNGLNGAIKIGIDYYL
ncbi:MAG: hypothetical protein KJ571_08625 [Bacteroidetes bacterium]|nr:hypothetical protein [Bacteroidota bacterium]